MAIMNSKGDRAPPWKMHLWIFVSAMLLPPAIRSTLQVFMVCSMKFMTSCDILYILRLCNYLLIRVFHISVNWWFFTGVCDSKSSQVSRTLLSILAVLNNVVVWMVSTRPPTSKSSSPFSNPLVTVPNAPITIGIIVTCMFHSFLIPQQGRDTYPSFYILSDLFCSQPGKQSRQFCKFSSFCWLLLGLVFWPRLGEFFTPALAEGLSLKSKWQQVSPILQNSS